MTDTNYRIDTESFRAEGLDMIPHDLASIQSQYLQVSTSQRPSNSVLRPGIYDLNTTNAETWAPTAAIDGDVDSAADDTYKHHDSLHFHETPMFATLAAPSNPYGPLDNLSDPMSVLVDAFRMTFGEHLLQLQAARETMLSERKERVRHFKQLEEQVDLLRKHLAQKETENGSLQKQVRLLENQLEVQQKQVLVMLPNGAAVTDGNQIAANIQVKLGRPVSLSDLTLMYFDVPSSHAPNEPLALAAEPLRGPYDQGSVEPDADEAASDLEPTSDPKSDSIRTYASAVTKPDLPRVSHVDSPAALRTPQPIITAVVPVSPVERAPNGMVTAVRPPGEGPAKYHVTIRPLRCSITNDDVWSLVQGAKSLVKISFPPLVSNDYAGRVVTYFFRDEKEAEAICDQLCNEENTDGALRKRFGLSDMEHEEAIKANLRGVDKKHPLMITWSNPAKRAAAASRKSMADLPATKQESSSLTPETAAKQEDATKRVRAQDQPKLSTNPYDVLQDVDVE